MFQQIGCRHQDCFTKNIICLSTKVGHGIAKKNHVTLIVRCWLLCCDNMQYNDQLQKTKLHIIYSYCLLLLKELIQKSVNAVQENFFIDSKFVIQLFPKYQEMYIYALYNSNFQMRLCELYSRQYLGMKVQLLNYGKLGYCACKLHFPSS